MSILSIALTRLNKRAILLPCQQDRNDVIEILAVEVIGPRRTQESHSERMKLDDHISPYGNLSSLSGTVSVALSYCKK